MFRPRFPCIRLAFVHVTEETGESIRQTEQRFRFVSTADDFLELQTASPKSLLDAMQFDALESVHHNVEGSASVYCAGSIDQYTGHDFDLVTVDSLLNPPIDGVVSLQDVGQSLEELNLSVSKAVCPFSPLSSAESFHSDDDI